VSESKVVAVAAVWVEGERMALTVDQSEELLDELGDAFARWLEEREEVSGDEPGPGA